MAALSAQEFEALWQSAQKGPVMTAGATKKVELDLSLTGMLDQYKVVANRYLAQGKVDKSKYDSLVAAVTTLQNILREIDEPALAKVDITQRADAVRQRVQDQITAIASALHP
jgi:hypothetical protein